MNNRGTQMIEIKIERKKKKEHHENTKTETPRR
jgi:hypothetical protein